MLSLAYYLILESDNPLSRFTKWSFLHQHPYGKEITSQRSSELFASITEEERYRFFRLQANRRCEKEYWAYDITSISSYSECLRQVKYGMNKEYDNLPQLNLALLFGQESNLPFYYRKLPGNISDVKAVRNMLVDMDFLSLKKIHLVMDRGFYSAENINSLNNCATRLRISLRDASLAAADDAFKQLGAHGVVRHGDSIQIIIGLHVPQLRENMESLMNNPSSSSFVTES